MAAGALGNLRRRRAESVANLVVLAVKLAYEALAGPLPGSVGVSGGPIVTQAHLYGAAGGVAAAALISIGNRWRAPI